MLRTRQPIAGFCVREGRRTYFCKGPAISNFLMMQPYNSKENTEAGTKVAVAVCSFICLVF
jgi:hypothetical protein